MAACPAKILRKTLDSLKGLLFCAQHFQGKRNVERKRRVGVGEVDDIIGALQLTHAIGLDMVTDGFKGIHVVLVCLVLNLTVSSQSMGLLSTM